MAPKSKSERARKKVKLSTEDITSSIRAHLEAQPEDLDDEISLEIDDISDEPEVEIFEDPIELSADDQVHDHLDIDTFEDEGFEDAILSIPTPSQSPKDLIVDDMDLEDIESVNVNDVELHNEDDDLEDDDIDLLIEEDDIDEILETVDLVVPVETLNESIDEPGTVEELTSKDTAKPLTSKDNIPAEARQKRVIEESQEVARKPQAHMNLSELRLDVVRISADIESGEELYRRAQQRVESLISFVERAEVVGSLLSKMEPENRRLKSVNRALESDIRAHTERLAGIQARLEEERRMASDAQRYVDKMKLQLEQATEALEEQTQDVDDIRAECESLRMQGERTKTSLEIETRQNITLRETLEDMSDQIERLSGEKLDIAKEMESLRVDHDDQTRANTLLQSEIANLRVELSASKRENATMRADLEDIQSKITQYSSRHERQLAKRDDRIVSLQNTIADLEDKLRYKAGLAENAVNDATELKKLRSAHEVEREKLEKIIVEQNHQLRESEQRLLKSKQSAQSLDMRYRDVARELETQRDYRPTPVTTDPDIYPAMEAREEQLRQERERELDRKVFEAEQRIAAREQRDPGDKRYKFLDNPNVSISNG